MMKSTWRQLPLVAGSLVLTILAGCASAPAGMDKPATAAAAPAATAKPMAAAPAVASTPVSYFAVLPENERYYLFTDPKLYSIYLEHEEVALTKTRIGASPTGTTVVFGMTDADAKASGPTLAEQLYDGKLVPGKDFYGEVFKDGRFYVFGDFADMQAFLEHGEVAYAFTDIGTGPKGASLVWVLNKDSIKNGRPKHTMDKFAALRSAK
jgi:hypothetical protein